MTRVVCNDEASLVHTDNRRFFLSPFGLGLFFVRFFLSQPPP